MQKLQELLLLLLLQQQQAGSCIAYTDASARIVLKLQKVLLRGKKHHQQQMRPLRSKMPLEHGPPTPFCCCGIACWRRRFIELCGA